MPELMHKDAREQMARFCEKTAQDIRDGRVCWLWLAVQFPEGRITIASKDAPQRPKGMS